jgi:N-acetylglutamate synthase-like GNAT family acetyltransferase
MIRPFRRDDKESLLEIFILNTPRFFASEEIVDFESYLNENWKSYLTIERKNEIVGGTGYQITDEGTIGRITWIFFHPDCVGLGLGRQAVEYCLDVFRKVSSIQKIVVTTSQLAHKFFGKFDFQLICTEKDYWGEGLDLYLMELKLQDVK